MNFCALKITKNEILGPKKFKIEKLGLKKSQKLKICTQKFTEMEKLHKFQSSVFYEFGPTVIWFTFFKLKRSNLVGGTMARSLYGAGISESGK